jgi:hypothetical protein
LVPFQTDFISEAAAQAAALIVQDDILPVDYVISAVIGATKGGEYKVEWEDGSLTWEPLSDEKVWAVWEPSPKEKKEGAKNFMLGKFILVEFTRVKKHLGHVRSYDKKSNKYSIEFEDGNDNGAMDLLAPDKTWFISDESF